MYISFYLDEDFYSGEVTKHFDDRSMWYRVDMGEELQFVIRMGEEGVWESDDIPKSLVYATGAEIERHEEGFESDPMKIRTYK